MKKIVFLVLLVSFSTILTAQNFTPVPNPNKPTFLNDDMPRRGAALTDMPEFNNYAIANLPESVLSNNALLLKIKDIWIKEQKEALSLNNQLAEKQARLRTLETAEKADIKAINKVIDETTELQNKLMKLKAANKQDVRSLLDDDERLAFDLKQTEPRVNMNFKRLLPEPSNNTEPMQPEQKFRFQLVK